MYHVLLIVPYPELEGLVKKVYELGFKQSEFSLDIKVIRAEDIQKEDLINTYDLFIGRGHSARKIKKLISDKPVVEIPITGYDILRAITEGKSKYGSKKMGLFISDRTVHDEKSLSEALDIDVQTYIVPSVDQLSETVSEAMENKIDTIIGGYSATSAAFQLGVNAVTIQTGEEAIYSVLREAMGLMETMTLEKKRNQTYQTILKESDEGIIYVNADCIIEIANKKAIQLLETDSSIVHNKKIDEVFPYLKSSVDELIGEQCYIINELINVDNMMFSFNLAPVIVGENLIGAVITFQSASKIQQLETEIRKKLSEKGLVAKYNFKDIIHSSGVMSNAIQKAKRFGAVESNVLIVGETGTGKELMAQSIHNISSRQHGPFVAVNCAALPENLLESELFGYVEGAFTGSKKGGKVGLFEQANNGTLFLDEISELPINFQGKLLRVLQERQIRRVGADRVINVDVRIIAATNRSLATEVKNVRFRQDLLYRLDILRLYISPLRDRKGDIYPLFTYFLKKYNKKLGRDISGCTIEARELLEGYLFSGNIRELRNITERVSVMGESDTIDGQLMKEALYPQDVDVESYLISDLSKAGEAEADKEKIIYALKQVGGRKSQAAQLLGMDRTTLWRKMKTYNIE